jgi:hypothetical protein
MDELDVLHVRPKGEGYGCPESLPQGGLDISLFVALILERGIKPIPTLSLPLKGRDMSCIIGKEVYQPDEYAAIIIHIRSSL